VHRDIGPLAVIEPRAAQQFVFERETERFDQVQARTGIRTQTNHVAGVGRDFGFVQNNVEHIRPVCRL
jgi:hypothetical protein